MGTDDNERAPLILARGKDLAGGIAVTDDYRYREATRAERGRNRLEIGGTFGDMPFISLSGGSAR
jgi:hypothetical protein